MKPIRTDECNFTYHLNGGTEENDLPCQVSGPDSDEQWVRSFFVHEVDEELDREALFISVLVSPEHARHRASSRPDDRARDRGRSHSSLPPFGIIEPLAPLVEISMADIGENIVLPLRSVPDPMYGQVLEGDILLTDEIKAAFRNGTPLQIKVNARPTPPIRVYTADYATDAAEESEEPDPDRLKTITVAIDPDAWSLLLEAWGDGTTRWDDADMAPVYRDCIDPISTALEKS